MLQCTKMENSSRTDAEGEMEEKRGRNRISVMGTEYDEAIAVQVQPLALALHCT